MGGLTRDGGRLFSEWRFRSQLCHPDRDARKDGAGQMRVMEKGKYLYSLGRGMEVDEGGWNAGKTNSFEDRCK